jgi:hypothetical protein
MTRGVLLISALLAIEAFSKADPPPFGTVVQQWRLHMSGAYAGAGIAWVRDSGKFYLMDQGYAGPIRVWNLDPADPPGTLVQVPWVFANMGQQTTDIPWGIAWDPDSGCFWISQIVDGNVYGGCYLLRHVWNGSTWAWGGTPRDSWLVGNGSNGGGLRCLWLAGFDKWYGGGYYIGAPVTTYPGPDTLGLPLFCPYAKTELGRIRLETACTVRGCALVPWDSAYILAWAWNDTLGLCKYDTTGRLLQSAPRFERVADLPLMWPFPVNPDDTVCLYGICADSANTFIRVSLGMLWWQLGSVGVEERTSLKAEGRGMSQTICRGVLFLEGGRMRDEGGARLLDACGRRAMDLKSGPNDIRHVAPGIYFVRSAESGTRSAVSVRKVVVAR